MLFILLLHFFGNPYFNKTSDLYDTIIRVVIALIIMGSWVSSKKNPTPEVLRGDIVALSLCIIVAIVFRFTANHFFPWLDWAFFSATTIFFVANLVLFQNRQNAKEDMLALEYYTFRRYIELRADNNALPSNSFE
jgi:peptidoglycan/LPS O-acetylase OafA/YrhL